MNCKLHDFSKLGSWDEHVVSPREKVASKKALSFEYVALHCLVVLFFNKRSKKC